MVSKTVIKRTRGDGRSILREFPFTQEMIPSLSPDWVGPEYLRDYRSKAWEAFNQLSLPTNRDEAWRRTDIGSLKIDSFRLASEVSPDELPTPPEELLQPLVGDKHGGQLLLSSNQSQLEIDPEITKKGVVFTDLKTAELEHPEILVEILGKIVRPDEGKFAALSASLAQNGVFIYVPKGVHVSQPLHSVLWGPGVGLAYLSHILVWLDEGSSLTYVHEAASPTEVVGQTLHSGIVEIFVGDSANLQFIELQSWGEHVWNFSHERTRVGRDGNLDWTFSAVGSHLTKNFSDLDLTGQGASGRMSGFYFTEGRQHLDHDTQQNHLAPNTTSDLLFKGALKDRSRSVWQGMIYVAPGAQKTDGYQANRNLVLSKTARADSIPGLEILADDVRCTHGATVGKIEPEPIFYLKSRGIPEDDAIRMLVEGFFDPIMQRIPYDGVRNRLQNAISEKLKNLS
jgi:Fe-S cluster assembly protein SufD